MKEVNSEAGFLVFKDDGAGHLRDCKFHFWSSAPLSAEVARVYNRPNG